MRCADKTYTKLGLALTRQDRHDVIELWYGPTYHGSACPGRRTVCSSDPMSTAQPQLRPAVLWGESGEVSALVYTLTMCVLSG